MKLLRLLKITVDIAMTALFLVMMAYHITGNVLHEWLGTMLFVLFIIHHILNWRWYGRIFRGRYTVVRILMTGVNVLLFISMAGMMISGILLSREVFSFLHLRAGMFGRRLHMVSTAWGFCLMAIHLGLHGGIFAGMIKKIPNKKAAVIARIAVAVIACYGVYSFVIRQIGERMFLLMEYAFFDYEEPAMRFFADYISILIFFATFTYYGMKVVGKMVQKRKGREYTR